MPVLLNLPFFARRDYFSMDGTGGPVPEHLWFVGQVPDLPLLQNLSMAGREPAPQPSPNVETPDTGRNCFLRGEMTVCGEAALCHNAEPRRARSLQEAFEEKNLGPLLIVAV